ncbi:uncharacterized protein METZ01_LOCUS435182, partial [marine metagenome]
VKISCKIINKIGGIKEICISTVNYAKMQSKAWYGDERITLRFPE